jgi:hypothetical protein
LGEGVHGAFREIHTSAVWIGQVELKLDGGTKAGGINWQG